MTSRSDRVTVLDAVAEYWRLHDEHDMPLPVAVDEAAGRFGLAGDG